MIKNSLKFLLCGGAALLMTACSDDSLTNGNNKPIDPVEGLNTAIVQIGQWGQTRASNVDTWSVPEHDHSDLEKALDFTLPENAIDITAPNFDKNGSVYYIPETFKGSLNFNWQFAFSAGSSLYNYGEVNGFENINFNGIITVYNARKLTWNISSGGRHNIYNAGDLTITNCSNIGSLNNNGNMVIRHTDMPDDMKINSIGGTIEIPSSADLKATCDIHNTMKVGGNLTIQNSRSKYICDLEVEGRLYVTDDGFSTSHINAKTIELNGHPIKLMPNALIETDNLIIPNSNSIFNAYEGYNAYFKIKDIEFRDNRNFENSFSGNIRFNISGNIKTANDGNFSQASYIQKYGNETGLLIDANELPGPPLCGDEATPEIPTENGPKLELITSVEAPGHDHNSDKTEENRKLSATSIDWDGNTIYVSYHMRGDENHYAGDTYDKDGIEGCIETWRFGYTSDNQTRIELGKFMWTNDFDFNHLIIDGGNIITVGHMEKKGAIIARIPNTFADFNLVDDDQNTYSSEMFYKVLTTDVKLYGDYENESGNITNQFIDYEDAGDGNCLIRVGDEYYVATYAGYGRVDATTLRSVKDEEGKPMFVSTPGSAKHIINNNGEIAVLYLNSRPTTTATAQSTATLATFSTNGFPYSPSTTALGSFVQPIDGKNVLTAYNGDYFACMGKGGLVKGNDIYSFGTEKGEPVNGIDIDGDYIYLASGSHLRVLDHSMNEIAKYNLPNKSANFVKVISYNGEKYILVAFGQAGIKVFRLTNI